MNERGAPDLALVGGARVATDVLVQILGGAVNAGLGVIATVLIARGLGGATFGEWTTIFAVVQIASFVTDFGIEGAAVRKAADDPGREADWLGAAAVVRFLLTLPVTALCVGIVLLIATGPGMLTAGLLVAGTLLLGVPGIIANVVFGLRVRNDVLIATATTNSVLWTTAVIVLAPGADDIARLALAFVVIGALTASLGLVLALRRAQVRWRAPAPLRGDLARLALPIGLASVLMFAYGRIDQILVFELAGARDAGLYGAAYRVLTQGALIPVALITTLFPIMTAARADVERLKRAAQGAFDYLAMLALPAIAFALVEAEPFMRGLFGAEFSGSAPALRILMLALVPIYLSYLVAALVFVLDEQWRFVRYTAIGLALNVVLNLVLVPELGFIAAAWVTVLTEGLVVALGLSLVLRRLALRIRLARLARCAASAVTLGATLWVLKLAGTPLVAEIVVAALLYPVLLLATRALGPQDLATFRRRPDPPA